MRFRGLLRGTFGSRALTATPASSCLAPPASLSGFPDFFPNRPGFGQDEDNLSEAFIRGGYVSKWGLSNSVRLPIAPGALRRPSRA